MSVEFQKLANAGTFVERSNFGNNTQIAAWHKAYDDGDLNKMAEIINQSLAMRGGLPTTHADRENARQIAADLAGHKR